MVLEFCAGGDLSQAIKRRKSAPVDEGVARYLIKQLADGLKAMRDLNWVHRDLKPGNLLLSTPHMESAVLKIGDFGFARDLAPESLAETWVGSPLYMAPEILTRDGGGYDAKADLWSVGCILFELVMGRQPYGSRAGNHMELIDDIKADRKYVPDVPIPLNEACTEMLDRLLQRLPAQRISYDDFFAASWFGPASEGGKPPLAPGGGAGVKAANNLLSLVMSQVPAATPPSSEGISGGGNSSSEALMAAQVQVQDAAPSGAVVGAGGAAAAKLGGGVTPDRAVGTLGNRAAQQAGAGGMFSGGGGQRGSVPVDALRRSSSPAAERIMMEGERSVDSGEFEMVDGCGEREGGAGEAVMVDTFGSAQKRSRKPSVEELIQQLPGEVAEVAMTMNTLICDVVVCTREVVGLANDRLREEGGGLASQALVLYLWSLRILHRTLGQLHDVEARCGGMLPAKLTSEWHDLVRGHLNDDFCKAKLALRMGVEASLQSDAPWIDSAGQVNRLALGCAVAPMAERIAWDTAMMLGRTAASGEVLYGIKFDEARGMYRRALLLVCALMLDAGGVSKREDHRVFADYASAFTERLCSGPPSPMEGEDSTRDVVDVAARCARGPRLPWAPLQHRGAG